MTFQQFLARQNSVSGLASSHSSLDGVPFKIGPAFRPLPQPGLPSELLGTATRCEALHEEYYFETEEAVLAWSRARDEAKAKAKAAAERLHAEQARAAAALAAAESSSSSDSEEDTPDAPQQSHVNGATAGETSQPEQAQHSVKPPWQLPLATSVGNAILTPMPIQRNSTKVQSPVTPKTQVDLALFEQEGDPFDNLELQTIDEMAELRTLLEGGNVAGTSQEPSPKPDDQVVEGNSEDVSAGENTGQTTTSGSRAASSADSIYVNVSIGPSGMTVCNNEQSAGGQDESGQVVSASESVTGAPGSASQSASPSEQTSFVIEPTGSGDYVQIRPDYSQQSVSLQRDSAPVYANIGSGETAQPGPADDSGVVEYVNCESVRPTVPPVQPRVQSLGQQTAVGASGMPSNAAVSPATHSQSNANVASSASKTTPNAFVTLASASGVQNEHGSDQSLASNNHTYSNIPSADDKLVSPAYSNSFYGCSGSAGPGSPKPVKRVSPKKTALRSVSSNPDLSVQVLSPHPSSNPAPQPWNPSKPLPPTPVSDLRSSSSSTESIPTDRGRTPSPLVSSPSPSESGAAGSTILSEVDPYHSLSTDARVLVDNLTSMGFSRSRAARAVAVFGADEREVLDHMFHVDKLVEKKFAPALAETGLQLFKNDIQKAEQFLDLFQQFTELGFNSDRIQTALVTHQLDRDKALDYLTA